MQVLNEAIRYDEFGGQVESKLMTYSEEERQQNEINANNAKLPQGLKYLVIPQEVFDMGLSGNEAIILGFISSFLGYKEFFYFSNEDLGKKFNLGETTVSEILKRLKNKGLIDLSYKRKVDGGQIRKVYLATYGKPKLQPPESRSSNLRKAEGSIPELSIPELNKERGTFVPPSLEEVSEYIKQNAYNVDAEQFINFHQAKGWMIGKNKMKDWKAAIRTWHGREKDKPQTDSLRQAALRIIKEVEEKYGAGHEDDIASFRFEEKYGIEAKLKYRGLFKI